MSGYENEAPTGDVQDNEYVSRTGQSEIPVTKDETSIEDPIDPATADSDQQLERDDKEAINEDNIIGGRTRGAKPSGGYREPGDDEGIEDATSGNMGASRGAAT